MSQACLSLPLLQEREPEGEVGRGRLDGGGTAMAKRAKRYWLMKCEPEANLPREEAVQIAVEERRHEQTERLAAIDAKREKRILVPRGGCAQKQRGKRSA